jgi:hypothetical protein
MPHNDTEWRLNLLCKVRDQHDPEHVTLDVSMEDFDSFSRTITL